MHLLLLLVEVFLVGNTVCRDLAKVKVLDRVCDALDRVRDTPQHSDVHRHIDIFENDVLIVGSFDEMVHFRFVECRIESIISINSLIRRRRNWFSAHKCNALSNSPLLTGQLFAECPG